MKLSIYAKKHGISYRTAWNHFKAGQIPGAKKLASGTIVVLEPGEAVASEGKTAVYARINAGAEDERDLMQDFVSLVTSFTARLYGKRRSKRNAERLIENARLMAAAPELLEALKKVTQSLAWHAHGCCRGFDDGAPLPTNEAVELGKRTIAKAMGMTANT